MYDKVVNGLTGHLFASQQHMPDCDRVLRFHVKLFQCYNSGVIILYIGEIAVNLR